MQEAVAPSPFWGGLVKCAVAAGFLLWATPVQSQEQVICAPADAVRDVLEKMGLEKTAVGTLLDGDRVEAWEGAGKVVITILMPHPSTPTRCLVREMTVRRLDKGAQR